MSLCQQIILKKNSKKNFKIQQSIASLLIVCYKFSFFRMYTFHNIAKYLLKILCGNKLYINHSIIIVQKLISD